MNNEQIKKARELLEAAKYFYPSIFSSDNEIYNSTTKKDTVKAEDLVAFRTSLFSFTGKKDIADAIEYLQEVALSAVGPEDQPSSTTPQNLDDQQKTAEWREKLRKEALLNAENRTKVFRKSTENLKKQTAERQIQQTKTQEKVVLEVSPQEVLREKAREIFGGPDLIEKRKQQLRKAKVASPFKKNLYLTPNNNSTQVTLSKEKAQKIFILTNDFTKNPEKTISVVSSLLLDPKNIPLELTQSYTTEQLESFAPIVAKDILLNATNVVAQIKDSHVPPTSESITLDRPNTVILLRKLAESDPLSAIPEYAILAAQYQDFVGSWTSATIGPNLNESLHGSKRPQEFEITEEKYPNSIEVDINQLRDFTFDVADKYYNVLDQIKTGKFNFQGFTEGFSKISFNDFNLSDISRFMESFSSELLGSTTTSAVGAGVGFGAGIGMGAAYQFYAPTLFTSWQAQAVLSQPAMSFQMLRQMSFLPGNESLATALALSPSQQALQTYNIGLMSGNFSSFSSSAGLFIPQGVATVATPIVSATTAEGIVTGATVVVTETAGSAAGGAAVGATAGSVVPVVGTIIGAVVGFIGSWIATNWPKIKKWFEDNPLLGPLLLGGGALLFGGGSIFAGAGLLALGAGASLISGLGVGSALATIPATAARAVGLAISTSLSEIGKPMLITFLTFPLIVAFIMFVINTGAYITPNGESLVDGITGDPPPLTTTMDCPEGWPFNISYTVASQQGPYTPVGHTHYNAEAADISVYSGTPIRSTHKGIVTSFPFANSSAYGNYVQVQSVCEAGGKTYTFFTRYAHFSAIVVKTGTEVEKGIVLGFSGNTGTSTGPHLHYEFKYTQGDSTGIRTGSGGADYINFPPYLASPFVPKTIKRGCFSNCAIIP